MKVEIKYRSNEAIAAIKAAMIELIRGDGYYSMYPRPLDPEGEFDNRFGPGNEAGTGLVRRDCSDGWGSYGVRGLARELDDLDEFTADDLPAVLEAAGGSIGWCSCAGNYIAYEISPDETVGWIKINSRRHGIPCRAMANFEGEVTHYETREPEWSPWETTDDRAEGAE